MQPSGIQKLLICIWMWDILYVCIAAAEESGNTLVQWFLTKGWIKMIKINITNINKKICNFNLIKMHTKKAYKLNGK